LDEFKDLVGDLPTTDLRVGYEANTPLPPVIENTQVRKQMTRQRQTKIL
jgi:hypothetical protein